VIPNLGKFNHASADAVACKWFGPEPSIKALRSGGLIVFDDMQPDPWIDQEHRRRQSKHEINSWHALH
jgi:hypothetical protein